jgi:hypothetical protein
MIGLPYALGWSKSLLLLTVLALVIVVVVTQAAAILVTQQPPPTLDWFAAVTTVLIVAMFLWPPQFHYHFTEFLAPFMALTLALPVARLFGGARPDGGVAVTWPRTGSAKTARQVGVAIVGVSAVALAVVAAFQFRIESGAPRVIGPIPAAIDHLIPPGACVLTDQASVTLAANRFVSTDPNCPKVIDSLGTTLALSRGLKPQTGAAKVAAVNAAWSQAFSKAPYVLLTASNHRRIAWSPQLEAYFASHFHRVYESPRKLMLYVRSGPRAG